MRLPAFVSARAAPSPCFSMAANLAGRLSLCLPPSAGLLVVASLTFLSHTPVSSPQARATAQAAQPVRFLCIPRCFTLSLCATPRRARLSSLPRCSPSAAIRLAVWRRAVPARLPSVFSLSLSANWLPCYSHPRCAVALDALSSAGCGCLSTRLCTARPERCALCSLRRPLFHSSTARVLAVVASAPSAALSVSSIPAVVQPRPTCRRPL